MSTYLTNAKCLCDDAETEYDVEDVVCRTDKIRRLLQHATGQCSGQRLLPSVTSLLNYCVAAD